MKLFGAAYWQIAMGLKPIAMVKVLILKAIAWKPQSININNKKTLYLP
jgi:hypothetical protein